MLIPVSLLPLHLACQLLVSRNDSSLVNINLDTPTSKLAAELPGGYTVFPDVGVAYKYNEISLTWNAARKYCSAYGSNLAVIDSIEKIEYVRRINQKGTNVHVGFHRLFDSTEWTDIKNGLPATAMPWRPTAYETDMSRQCVGLVTSGSIGLYALGCSERFSFVCEIPIFKD